MMPSDREIEARVVESLDRLDRAIVGDGRVAGLLQRVAALEQQSAACRDALGSVRDDLDSLEYGEARRTRRVLVTLTAVSVGLLVLAVVAIVRFTP